MKQLSIKANAKINLGLRVVGLRDDGYHSLVTIFQRISLADELIVQAARNTAEYIGPVITDNPEDNLCVRAVNAFRKRIGKEFGAIVTLKKRIPSGSGLGGGSSDAGAILRAMAELYELDKDDERLWDAAESIGSDVSFFYSDYRAALAEGKGELLKPHAGLNDSLSLLIAWPGFGVSSRDAYRWLDDSLTFKQNDVKVIFRSFLQYQGGELSGLVSNDFETTIFAHHPVLAEARDRMLKAGAIDAGLCGSGSAIYGVFDGNTQVLTAAAGWKPPWLSFVCRPC